MITTSLKIATRPAWRATSARGVAACLIRNKSACAAAGPSMMMHDPEAEARGNFLEHFRRDSSLRGEIAYSLSFAGDSMKSDFESDKTFHLLDDRMKRQLRESSNALLSACAAAGPSTTMHEPEAEARGKFIENFQRDSSLREEIAYSLSFARDNLESDFESDNTFHLLDDRMKRQLRESYNSLLSPSDYCAQKMRSQLPPQLDLGHLEAWALGKRVKRKLPPLEEDDEEISAAHYARPLPKSISDITPSKLDGDARAIVVTDTKNPFRIVAVNTAWEHLCGYSREECKGRSLRLLQGSETDMNPVTAMVGKLLQGEQAGAILINYTKHGRKFQNDIKAGPVFDEMGKTVNFVGVLREVKDYDGSCEELGGNERSMQLPFLS